MWLLLPLNYFARFESNESHHTSKNDSQCPKNVLLYKKVMDKSEINEEFYKNSAIYFEYLRKNNESDYGFEDEYYFTIPAISNK